MPTDLCAGVCAAQPLPLFADKPIAPAEEPIADEPIAEEPIADEPIAPPGEPIADEPIAPAEEPIADEPIAPAEEPIAPPGEPMNVPEGFIIKGGVLFRVDKWLGGTRKHDDPHARFAKSFCTVTRFDLIGESIEAKKLSASALASRIEGSACVRMGARAHTRAVCPIPLVRKTTR